MIKNYVFYASGSISEGYGHLYRVLGIYQKYLLKKKCFFLYKNETQKNFYLSKKINAIKLNEFYLNEKFILIVDTKDNNIDYLDNTLKTSFKSICIDKLNKWIERFDKIVIPNFYYDSESTNKYSFKTPIYYGKKYCIIRKQIPDYKYKHKYLITFGGSDPFNLTRKILKLISEEVASEEIMVLLGKGFAHKEVDIKRDFPKIKLQKDILSTFEAIKNSKIIFTALGTTVQEIEAAHKKAVICFNFLKDKEDFNKILTSTQNKELWLNGGHYLNLNKDEIKSFIKQTNYNISNNENFEWGEGWRDILIL